VTSGLINLSTKNCGTNDSHPFQLQFALHFQYRTGDSSMLARTRFATLTIAAGTSLALAGRFAGAQQPAPAAPAAAAGPLVNDIAPDFTLQGADRYGLIKTPVKLSDFRGRTVVLAFFYQARTKG
jgi:cytochrome oxidase Cu insertion factor (SCO1/SenC/PrrC family)